MNEADIRAILQEELGNIAPEMDLRKLDPSADCERRSTSIPWIFSISSSPCIAVWVWTSRSWIIPSS